MHIVTNDRQTWYQSELLEELEVVHGFFTRLGGVSSGPYESLNMRTLGQDSLENVEENKLRALHVLELPLNQMRFARKLAHGIDGLINTTAGTYDEIDFLAATKTQPLGLGVADCVPVIVAQRDPDVVALIHAGWRGTVQSVVAKTVQRLGVECGLQSHRAVAAIGPAIASSSYEVGPEVVREVEKELPADVSQIITYQSDQAYLDTVQANKLQLQQAGITQIDVANIDVFANPDLFFSYRRDGETGRNGVFVSL